MLNTDFYNERMKMEIGNTHVIRIVWRKHLNAYNYIANDEMSKFESGIAEQGVNQSNGVKVV
jgi:hypothetical protein